MVLKSNSEVVPFWGKGKEAKMGLNQLGMRTLVESIFATLLPGMSNVTGRIRYYSFYCWLMQQFKEFGAGSDGVYHQEDFITFIRKAEYLLAVINYYTPNIQGIPGNTYVINHIDDDASIVDLSKGIISETGEYRGSYWANKWGILGQYYLSSVIDLSLLGRLQADGDFFGVTPDADNLVSGEALADTFALGVGEDGSLFINCVQRSCVTKKEAKHLAIAFNMHSYEQSQKERDLTLKCLMQKDYPSALHNENMHRQWTIRYVLEYIREFPTIEFRDQEFAGWMYKRYHKEGPSNPTLVGWYAYYMEESWQYLSSIVFSSVLDWLSDDEWERVSDVTESIASEICSYICKDADTTLSLRDTLMDLPETHEINSPAQAYSRILSLYLEDNDKEDDVRKTPGLGSLYADSPDDIFAYFRRIGDSLDVQFKVFVKEYLLEKIIYRHYHVSFVKQRQTGISSQKFIIERGCLKRIMKYDYSHTSPRLNTLISFLEDLGAVSGRRISPLGEEILTTCKYEN